MSLITLSNGTLTVTINSLGAELQSVRDAKNIERLWHGDPAFWANRAPVLFPIAGGLKEDRYTLNGQSYTLKKHGFAKNSEFEVESQTADSATFLLKTSDETRAQFPFEFELRLRYALEGNRIVSDYVVSNVGDGTMYFSIGAHEAYACPEGIEAYEIVFDEAEMADSYVLNGNLLSNQRIPKLENASVFPLKNEDFKVDALVFLDVKSRGVTLRSKLHNRTVRVEFPGFDYFLLWTKFGAPYICIEPWCGIQDFEGSSFDIREKRGILSVPKGETMTRTHTMAFA